VNGVLQSTVPAVAAQSLTSILGTNSNFQIGRAQWGTNGEFFNGMLDNVAVYDRELTPSEIRANYYATTSTTNVLAAINADIGAVSVPAMAIEDIDLPTSGANGTAIAWASDNAAVIATDGTVTRPDGANAQVKLTATFTLGGETIEKEFDVIVLAEGDAATLAFLADNFDLGIQYITNNITLASELGFDSAVTWSSEPAGCIAADGTVTRPAAGEGDAAVTLTATIAIGDLSVTKDFNVTVAEAAFGNLLAYTHPSPGAASNVTYNTAQGTRFATAVGDAAYAALNSGKPVLYSKIGTKRMIWPSVVRKPDGSFALIAADNNASDSVTVYDSADLTKFTGERLIKLNETSTNVREVAAVYDNGILAYRVYWRGSGNTYFETISDLEGTIVSVTSITQAAHAAALASIGYVGASFTYPTTNGTQGSAIGLTQAEYNTVVKKYARLNNTGVQDFTRLVYYDMDEFEDTFALPDRATLDYSDGSTKTLPVQWDQTDIDAIDGPGQYTISGTILQKTYADPYIAYRADPYVTKGSDGYYYFTASYPMVGNGDSTGYDRIVLRRSTTLEGLAAVGQNQKENTGGDGEIVIWNQSASSTNHKYVWAPEIHEINGKWYVFFTTSNASNNVWGIRPALIACGGDGDPFKPENWPTQATYMVAPQGDPAFNNFSLDMTYFESGGKSYVVWAHKPNTSDLRIATVNPNQPWILTSPSTLISTPEYTWESGQSDIINEGPAAILIGGKVFLAYAAASVDARYCIGSLTADENADLLDASVWEKSPYPLLATEDLENQNGPGHNSFTVDEYGNPIIVYHARTPGESPGGNTTNDGGLYDPGRHARIKPVHFAADGSVVFNMTPAEELDPGYKNVSITVKIVGGIRGELQDIYDEMLAEIAGNSGKYTPESWAKFEDAADYVEELLTDTTAVDMEFELAIDVLKDAYKGLQVRAAYSLLLNQIARAEKIIEEDDPDQYPADNWAAFMDLVEEALDMRDNPGDYTDDEMYAAAEALRLATLNLSKWTHMEELFFWMSVAEGMIAAPDPYIPAAIENLQSVLDDIEEALDGSTPTNAEVDAMIKDLLDAIWQAYDKGDKTALQQLYDELIAYDEDDYTPASWVAFEDALDKAKETLDDENAIDETIAPVYNALIAAEEQLVMRANFTSLIAAITQAQNILNARDNYVASTLVGMPALVTAGQTVAGNANATQAQVDAARDALRAAIAKVRIKPERSPLLAALNAASPLNLSLYTDETVQILNALVAEGQSLMALQDQDIYRKYNALDTINEGSETLVTRINGDIQTLADRILAAIAGLAERPAAGTPVAPPAAPAAPAVPVAPGTGGPAAGTGAGDGAGDAVIPALPTPTADSPAESSTGDAVSPEIDLPDEDTPLASGTGGFSPLYLIGIAALLIAAGFFLWFFLAKRRKDEEEKA
jgi:GH43 family beta-xylosidase